jgi:hypothetical protein
MRFPSNLWFAAVFIVAESALAEPLIEKVENFEIDWSNLTVRYTGSAHLNEAEKPETLRDIELLARRAGANTAYASARSVLSKKVYEVDPERVRQDAIAAADELVKAASSTQTRYFADGTVQVGFEAPLGPSLAAFARTASNKGLAAEWEQPKNTGIVFEIDGKAQPMANYRILNSAGASLFASGDLAPEVYASGLMGRWFLNARDHELKRIVGDDPAVVKLTHGSPGTFIVDEDAWRALVASNAQHLLQARIALNVRNR